MEIPAASSQRFAPAEWQKKRAHCSWQSLGGGWWVPLCSQREDDTKKAKPSRQSRERKKLLLLLWPRRRAKRETSFSQPRGSNNEKLRSHFPVEGFAEKLMAHQSVRLEEMYHSRPPNLSFECFFCERAEVDFIWQRRRTGHSTVISRECAVWWSRLQKLPQASCRAIVDAKLCRKNIHAEMSVGCYRTTHCVFTPPDSCSSTKFDLFCRRNRTRTHANGFLTK
jgi:hypothetical protein